MNDEHARLERRATRERTARKEAERLLEARSTELYKTNQALQESRDQLEARVEERTRELEDALRQAEDADAAKTRFLGTLTHELRTPLTSILGYTTDLLEQQPANRDLDAVHRNATHLLTLINEVLDYATVENDGFRCSPEPTDIRSMLDQWLEGFRAPAAKKNLQLKLSVDDEVPRSLQIDPLRVTQVLTNFLGNGLKFTDRGTLAVRVFLSSGDARTIRFDVLDTGRGIPAHAVQTIFEEFQQTERDDRARGTGLGLPICKRLAEAMEGRVQVRSTVGRGSCFTLELPLRPEDPEADSTVTRLDGERVLLAEDSKDSRVLVRRWLEAVGATVVEATDGSEAVERCGSCTLVLMDVNMAGVDGLTATRQLRQQGFDGPVFALTADNSASMAQACKASGCDEVLHKPITKDTLLRALTAEAR